MKRANLEPLPAGKALCDAVMKLWGTRIRQTVRAAEQSKKEIGFAFCHPPTTVPTCVGSHCTIGGRTVEKGIRVCGDHDLLGFFHTHPNMTWVTQDPKLLRLVNEVNTLPSYGDMRAAQHMRSKLECVASVPLKTLACAPRHTISLNRLYSDSEDGFAEFLRRGDSTKFRALLRMRDKAFLANGGCRIKL